MKDRKTGGRQPGSLNKCTLAVRAAAHEVAERLNVAVPSAFEARRRVYAVGLSRSFPPPGASGCGCEGTLRRDN